MPSVPEIDGERENFTSGEIRIDRFVEELRSGAPFKSARGSR
jgi:hypothetical protein